MTGAFLYTARDETRPFSMTQLNISFIEKENNECVVY